MWVVAQRIKDGAPALLAEVVIAEVALRQGAVGNEGLAKRLCTGISDPVGAQVE